MKQQHQWRSLVFDLFLLAVAIGEVTQVVSWESPTDLALAVIAVGGLLLRRRLPWVSFLLAYPAFVWGTATIVLLIALFSLAARTERRWLITATSVLTFIGALRIYWGLPDLPYAGSLLAYAVLYAVGPVALGQLLRTREELSRRIAELSQARQHELERARADVLSTERARISREMHDVVSHQVSLIAVQAGALQVRAREGHTSDAARTIRGLAVRTLDELRQMVGVLRADGAGREPLDPQPRISDLPRLIEESGLKVQLRNELPALLTPALERAIYRTVQEGLTNARKHAPGAAVTISAKAHSDQVEVTVHSGQATATVLALPSSGTGLLGLRERALLLGGSLTATHTSDGFRLHFTAPLHVATTART